MPKPSIITRVRDFLSTPRGTRIGLSAAQFTFWSALAPITYFSLYLESIGFTGTQLGSMTAVRSLITFIFSIVIAYLSDLLRRHRRILIVCALGMVASLIVIPRLSTYFPILLVTAFYSLFMAPIEPILNESILRAVDHPRDFSRVRVGGSIGWGLSIFITGLIMGLPGMPLSALFPIHIILILAFLLFIPFIPDTGKQDIVKEESRPSLSDLWELIRTPRFLPWIGLVFLWGFTESSVMSFFYQHIQSIGGAPFMMGLSIAVAIFGEIIGFFFAKRVQGRIGARRMMVYSFILRFAWFLMLAVFKNPCLALPLQVLGGGSFALIEAGSVAYVNQRAPRRIGTTAQALRSAVFIRLSIAVGAPISGYLYQTHGSAYLYAFMAIVSALALLLGVLLRASDVRNERKT